MDISDHDSAPESDITEQQILAELEAAQDDGATLQIRCYQLEGKGTNGQPIETYLFDLQPDELAGLWQRLRDTEGLGTGVYRVRVRKIEGGRGVQIHQVTRSVKSLRFPGEPIARQALPPPASSPASDPTSSRLDRLERLLEQQLVAQNQRSSVGELIEAFNTFNTMQQNVAARAPQLDAMEIFKQGMELAQTAAGGAPAPGGGGLLESAVPIVEKVLTMIQNRQPQPGAPVVPAIAPPPAIAGAPATPAPPPVAQQYIIELLRQVATMHQSDPVLVAEFVFENVPLSFVRQVVQQPAILDQLAIAVPEISQHRGFFTALRLELERGMMAPDEEPTTETGGPGESPASANGGDPRDAQNNAAANP